MIDWIFASDEYKEMYHGYLDSFISTVFESGKFVNTVDGAYSIIAPYVEKDPTRFCTYEAFENGYKTIREFCLRRAESVRGQLNGTIGTTSAAQKENPDALVSGDGINVSSMGSMGMGGGRGGNENGGFGNFGAMGGNRPERGEQGNAPSGDMQFPSGDMGNFGGMGNAEGGQTRPSAGNAQNGQTRPSFGQGQNGESWQGPSINMGTNRPGMTNPQNTDNSKVIMLCVSVAVLLFGVIFAAAYKRR